MVLTPLQKQKRADLCCYTKPTLGPSTFTRKVTIMTTHSSAIALEETPHETETTTITISDALIRRAQTVINDRSIDPQWRAIVRYALETTDPWLADLVRRADTGETIIDTVDFSLEPGTNSDDSSEEKIEALAEIICRAGDEAAAALFVLMGTLENSTHPKLVANTAKHFAFTRCGELNLYGMVDAQIAVVEGELLAGNRFPLDWSTSQG
jgi:hypothetical protein